MNNVSIIMLLHYYFTKAITIFSMITAVIDPILYTPQGVTAGSSAVEYGILGVGEVSMLSDWRNINTYINTLSLVNQYNLRDSFVGVQSKFVASCWVGCG